ncbi:MAG: type II toxin-antitoxin system PemK/MazF family toxin [Ardenticatenaceae bacterium]|nr:type II toxin-antitoxin system PemK/MazF family toxin [Ardenticatenaceae bacterium]
MARGDVLMVELPYPRGRDGHEQVGTRPAVVVQSNAAQDISTLIIVPATSNLKAIRFPYTIEVVPSSQNGLSQKSILLVSQMRAMDKTRVVRTLGTLEKHYLTQLDEEIMSLLSLLR